MQTAKNTENDNNCFFPCVCCCLLCPLNRILLFFFFSSYCDSQKCTSQLIIFLILWTAGAIHPCWTHPLNWPINCTVLFLPLNISFFCSLVSSVSSLVNCRRRCDDTSIIYLIAPDGWFFLCDYIVGVCICASRLDINWKSIHSHVLHGIIVRRASQPQTPQFHVFCSRRVWPEKNIIIIDVELVGYLNQLKRRGIRKGNGGIWDATTPL